METYYAFRKICAMNLRGIPRTREKFIEFAARNKWPHKIVSGRGAPHSAWAVPEQFIVTPGVIASHEAASEIAANAYYTAAELLAFRLPGLPVSRGPLVAFMARECWAYRDVKSRGRTGVRREYAPPPYVVELIAASRPSGTTPANAQAVPDVPPPGPQTYYSVSELLRIGHKLGFPPNAPRSREGLIAFLATEGWPVRETGSATGQRVWRTYAMPPAVLSDFLALTAPVNKDHGTLPFYSHAQLVLMDLPRVPESPCLFQKFIAREGWPYRENRASHGHGVRREYLPPPEMAKIIESRLRNPALAYAVATRHTRMTVRRRQLEASRLKCVLAWAEFIQANPTMGRLESYAAFCADYNANHHLAGVTDEMRADFPEIEWSTLSVWVQRMSRLIELVVPAGVLRYHTTLTRNPALEAALLEAMGQSVTVAAVVEKVMGRRLDPDTGNARWPSLSRDLIVTYIHTLRRKHPGLMPEWIGFNGKVYDVEPPRLNWSGGANEFPLEASAFLRRDPSSPLRSADDVKALFLRTNTNIGQWAAAHGFSRAMVREALRGPFTAVRQRTGRAYACSILLGMDDGVIVEDDPDLQRRYIAIVGPERVRSSQDAALPVDEPLPPQLKDFIVDLFAKHPRFSKSWMLEQINARSIDRGNGEGPWKAITSGRFLKESSALLQNGVRSRS